MKADFHCAHLHNLSPQGTRDVPTALSIVFTTPSVPLVGDRNGAQTASLYGWRTIRGLRQQRSCGFLCGDEPAFTQGVAKGLLARCFFRKTTNTPLNLKFFSKINPSFFTIKEGSTSHLGLLPSGKKRKPLLLVALNRYAIRLADHQRSTPAAKLRFFVRG